LPHPWPSCGLRTSSSIFAIAGFACPATLVKYTEQYQCFGLVGDGSGNQERGEREGGTRFMLRGLTIALDQAQQLA
jgi:hypothetical protein